MEVQAAWESGAAPDFSGLVYSSVMLAILLSSTLSQHPRGRRDGLGPSGPIGQGVPGSKGTKVSEPALSPRRLSKSLSS